MLVIITTEYYLDDIKCEDDLKTRLQILNT